MLELMIKEDLLGRGRSTGTAKSWETWLKRFTEVCGEKEEYGRADIVKYMAWCREKGYKQNSIMTMLRPVKLLAQIQGWQFPKLSIKKIKDSEIKRPMLEKEDLIRMIEVRDKYEGKEKALLALATTYGMRRAEMSNPMPCRIEGDKIRVYTVKGGVETLHLIPEEIREIIKEFKPCDIRYTTKMLARMLRKAGVKKEEKVGWHSIRRCLATELLLSEASALNIVRFMRWSDASVKGEFGMLAIYAKKNQERVDSEMFNNHPFLKYWR